MCKNDSAGFKHCLCGWLPIRVQQIVWTGLLCLSLLVQAAEQHVVTAISPDYRMALLELYTSEGCSSCPPADRFLTRLKKTGVHRDEVIPLAFHVTYWDYIGWHDPYAQSVFDQRQRLIARRNASKTVYTPQFVLAGQDYRRYATFSDDVREYSQLPAILRLRLSVQADNMVQVDRRVDKQAYPFSLEASPFHPSAEQILPQRIHYYVAVTENNLQSQVEAGENAGKRLRHDYVVRQLLGPYTQDDTGNVFSVSGMLNIDVQWQPANMQLVAFAEDPASGEILQAVRLRLPVQPAADLHR